MGQKHCIITGDPITPETDSKAHVIPSALGGRLKPLGLLSKGGNTLLGDTVDLLLIQAFQALMTLLDGSRDRGTNRPVRLTDENGRTLIFEFGEPLKLAQPSYNEAPTGDGVEIHIDARNLKELRTLLGRVKAKVPSFDIDEAVRQAVVTRTWPDGVLRGQLQIGPGVVFPAVFVAASVFAAHHGLDPHPGLRAYVSGFDPSKPVLPPDTFFFMPDQPWFTAPGEVTHIVVLIADPARQRLLVCIELFNVMTVGIVLPYEGDTDRTETYAVNVLTGTPVPVTVNTRALAGVRWGPTHQNGDPDLQRMITERLEKLLATAKARAWQAEIDAFNLHHFGDLNKPLTLEGFADAVRELADFTLHEWDRPLTTVADRESDARMFDQLCGRFEELFKPVVRPTFRAKIQPERARLQAALAQARAAHRS